MAGAVIALAAVPAWRTKLLSAKFRAPAIAMEQGSGQWTPFGAAPLSYVSNPGTNSPHSGRVSSIAVDPRDSRRWLLGVGNGGVWETRDSGETWTPITDDAPTLAIGAVAFAQGNPDTIYAATGEYAGFAFTHVGVGILRSTNGGQSWALLGQESFARAAVRRIRVDPNDANIVLATSAHAGFGRDNMFDAPAPPPFGILRSTNGGLNWSRTLTGEATALEIDPTNFSRQYAAISDKTPRITPPFPTNGVYRSADGGMAWALVNGPWGPEPSVPRRIELAIAPSDPNVLYASIQVPNGGGLLGLFRTNNAWADPPTWIQISTSATGSGGYCGPNKCNYSHVLSVDPRDANTLFAGGETSLWRCTNCGPSPTWTRTTLNGAPNPNVHPDYHALAWAGNRLVAGNDGGVWSTTDFGATWLSHNHTLRTLMFFSGALHPTDSSFVVGGFRDFPLTVYRPSTGWRTLRQASTSEWGEGEVALSSSRPDTDWMAAWIWGVIQRTTDGGLTSLQVDGAIDKTGAAFVSPVRKCPANDDVFLAGTTWVWRTNDFFSSTMPSWTKNSQTNVPSSILGITFVEGDRSCNTYAYVTATGVVRLTKDGGTTWTDLDPSKSLPSRPINSIAFDPTNANRAFVAVSSYDVATPTKPGHIFRSDNALSSSPTWARVGPPDQAFADMPFNVIAIDPRDTRLVYAGSDNGLWQSTDGGATFAKVGRESGLPPASVFDIQINPATNRTVIFTYGRGAYELAR